jgi:hypothetical protein
MAAYSQFLGDAVKVQYRLGEILLSASGTFVADSGRSIFLEQNLEQRGRVNHFRWEIPYAYIHRIQLSNEAAQDETALPSHGPKNVAADAGPADSSSQTPTQLPFPPTEKTA